MSIPENSSPSPDTLGQVSAQQLGSENTPAGGDSTAGQSPSEAGPQAGATSRALTKRGAKPGNAHALRTGLRSPKCPIAARGIDGMRYAFRRNAFASWRAKNGVSDTEPVPFFVECRIDTATRHHKNALLIEWLIRTTANMPADQFQAMLDKSADFSDRRDKALRDIGLHDAGDATVNPWSALDNSSQ